jgi:hypothetical protein
MPLPVCNTCGKVRLDEERLLQVDSDMSRALIDHLLHSDGRNEFVCVNSVVQIFVEQDCSELRVKEYPHAVNGVLAVMRLQGALTFLRDMGRAVEQMKEVRSRH